MGFVQRAFTPGGGEDPAAVAAREAGAQQQALQAAKAQAPTAPTMPTAPAPPPMFQPGQAPGQKQRAQLTASTMLGAAAAGGQTAKKTLLGQ
jgi:hypothetical protein